MQLSSYLGQESDQARGWTSGKLVRVQFSGGTSTSPPAHDVTGCANRSACPLMLNSVVCGRAKRPGREVDRTIRLFLQIYIRSLISPRDCVLVHRGNCPLLAVFPI